MAEINGLLNRRTTLKLYRGFESLPHRIQEPQLPLWLFIFLKIFLLVKVVPPAADRIPPSPHSRAAIVIVAFYFFRKIFFLLKGVPPAADRIPPSPLQKPQGGAAVFI